MKKVCFLLPEGLVKPSSLFGAIEVFEKANEFLVEKGRSRFYELTLIGSGISQSLLNAQFVVQPDRHNLKTLQPDIIIIPGLYEQDRYALEKNQTLINWMVQRYAQGTELASMCTGAFLLAATGLLKNEECSTHWRASRSFAAMFPDVHLRTDKIITELNGIYTAGGAQSSLNLILYLVEKYNGRAAALYCAKILQIDIERNSQSPFIFFEGYKKHEDDVIRRSQVYIEKNIDERITVEFLASQSAMSRRSFIRRFKKATQHVPIEYIQKVKMESAKRELEQNRKNVNEVMYAVGYTDRKAFRNMFKKVTGLSPVDYRAKYSQLSTSNA
ncbi:transcriptional regulator, AraC family with amidase-like domain [Chitinophaga rupis]|uniref:Transcriptional regulator, AraC family with amidase-like domain n=1 Tax=Chitinophaga rupis TaxID=573321 RepID=A0A1H7RCP9_9BACT|nr:helix-turn-helix domain-containing protein [Chitinophaga rupis]SEL57912.1 transcriptional regulator, AraC family with amidase-like domain [Chitinophaga rupis]